MARFDRRQRAKPADKVTLLRRKGLPMTSSKWIAVTMVFGLGLAFVPAAWADPASDACAALVDARGTLYSMISAKDKSAQDALNVKVQAASTESSLALAACTFTLSASCADLSLALIIEYSVPRASTRAAQASLAGSAQAAGTNASPRPNTIVTAIHLLLVIGNPFLLRSVTLSAGFAL